MGNLDDILRDDDTQAMPPANEQRAQELHEENAKMLKKLNGANDEARTAADVELLQQINVRLAGRKAGKQRVRPTATAGDGKTFDKVFGTFLVIGGVLGLVVGMIVAGLLETAMIGTRLEDVSGWIRLLVVLLVAGFGVFLGSAAHDKWRK